MSVKETIEDGLQAIHEQPDTSRGVGKWRWCRRALSVAFIVVLVVGIVYVIRQANWSVILSQPWGFWVVQVVILFAYLLLASLLYMVVLRRMGIRCTFLEVFLVSQASYASSYLGPLKLSFPLRIFLFKKVFDTSYSKAVSATVVAQVLKLGALVFVAIAGGVVRFHDYYVYLLVALAALAVAGLTGLMVLRLARLISLQQILLERVRVFLVSIYDGIGQVGAEVVVGLGVLSILQMVLLSLSSFLIINQFGACLSFFDIIFIDAISVFVGFVSLMPMGLGARDATSILLLHQAGVSQDIVYSIIIVQRMIWSLLLLLVGLLSAIILGLKTMKR